MDRRAVFFLIAAAVCAALIFAVPEDSKLDLTLVGKVTSVAFLLAALVSWLDHRDRHRERN
jgi:hypothetical protein